MKFFEIWGKSKNTPDPELAEVAGRVAVAALRHLDEQMNGPAELRRLRPGATILPNTLAGALYAPHFNSETFGESLRKVMDELRPPSVFEAVEVPDDN